MTKHPVLYPIAGLLTALVLAVLIAFAVYGQRLPYMVHQQCTNITSNWSFCNTVIPLPHIE
jgi:hypothetical protein